jgi:hypothetical protein
MYDNIFDEKTYAENLLSIGPKRPMLNRNLQIIAKYYRYLGKTEFEIRDKLEEYCIDKEKSFNSIIYSDKLDKAVRDTKNDIVRIPKNVSITKNELEFIRKFNDYKYRKIIFTALVLAKYYKITDTRIKINDNKEYEHYYLNKDFINILNNAHVFINRIKRDAIQNNLQNLKILCETQYGFKLDFTDTKDSSDVIIWVTDMEKIISFLPNFCDICGKIIKKEDKKHNGNRCDSCYQEYRVEKNKEIKNKWNQN